MKVLFLKDHLTSKKGDVLNLDEAAAGYLIRVGVASEKKEVIPVKEKKEITPAKEKKEK